MGDMSFHGRAHLLANTVTHVLGLICHLLTGLEVGSLPISIDRTPFGVDFPTPELIL
jgi:hypothetical protein